MYIIKIGSDSEFLKLEIPSNINREDWIDISVEIKTDNFKGGINPSIEARDILNFLSELESLYNTLKGLASFETREGQISFKLEAKPGGHIEVSGVAWAVACYGSKLEFCFSIDQTFLQQPLKNLTHLASQLK